MYSMKYLNEIAPKVPPEMSERSRMAYLLSSFRWQHWMKRCLWALSVTTSLSCALWMIYQMGITYLMNPIITIFNPRDIPVGILPFPAITVCSINNVQQSKMEGYIRRAETPNMTDEELLKAYSDLYNVNHICRSARTFTERLSTGYDEIEINHKLISEMNRRGLEFEATDPTRLLREASLSCSEMVLFCLWMDEKHNCTSLFHEVETDYGYCCTFNLIPLTLLLRLRNDSRDKPEDVLDWMKAGLDTDSMLLKSRRIKDPAEESDDYPEEMTKYPYRQIYAGRSSGLSILLFSDLDEYNCTNTDSEGFLVSLNSPLDYPRMRDNAIAIPSGAEVFISVKPELTIPDDSIREFNLEKRKCYFGDEFQLKYYAHYTTSNCIDECIANWTLFECDCVQYYMPRSSNDTVCPPKKYFCTENVRKKIIQKGLKEKCKHCLPTCTDLEYSSETTHLKIKQSAMNKLMSDLKWKRKLNPQDMSIVHIYFGTDSTYPRQRKEIYGIIELLSNAGGLLSLFIGFSVVKLLKYLYDFVIGIACKKREIENESIYVSPSSFQLKSRGLKADRLRRVSLSDGTSITVSKRGGIVLENDELSSVTSSYKKNWSVATVAPSSCFFTTVHVG